MVIHLSSVCVRGISGKKVEVETDISNGLPSLTLVGLGDTAIQESRERVRSAIRNSGFSFPPQRITVNLAPADIRKSGPGFDLAIAMSIVSHIIHLPQSTFAHTCFIGELALDGKTRHTDGVLIATLFAKDAGYHRIFVPLQNATEAAVVAWIEVIGIESLSDAIGVLQWTKPANIFQTDPEELFQEPLSSSVILFWDIIGQSYAKRALEIAAAGWHHVLLEGAPGSGKSLLARGFQSILPDFRFDESIEVSSIYSTAWLLQENTPLIRTRPFRTVYHTATVASLTGGGPNARPGEMALAHRGVLFLDELLEFDKRTLETLRQPLEEGEIRLARASGNYRYPARFTMIAATNPCPCGYHWDPEKPCECSAGIIQHYQSRLSGPIEDRIDLYVHVTRLKTADFQAIHTPGESSEHIKARVETARIRQRDRFWGWKTNAEMTSKEVKSLIPLDAETEKFLAMAVDRFELSGRAYFRILKLARTIADIENTDTVTIAHISEALWYRRRS